MRYKTEVFDIGYERGYVGPSFDSFDEAKKWCDDECKSHSMYINVANIYSVRKEGDDWMAPDIYTCAWSMQKGEVVDITEEWAKRWNNIKTN